LTSYRNVRYDAPMITVLTTGVLLGLAAGLAPGPLLTLVIAVALQRGVKEGAKVALSPMITDLPIILLALLLVNSLSGKPWPLGILSLLGGLYVCLLAWKSMNIHNSGETADGQAFNSLKRGVLVNLLNPHPYLFWFSVGTPMLVKLWAREPWLSMVWISGFYGLLIGSKVALAMIVGRTRTFLNQQSYVWINRILGALLALFAALLIRDGLKLLDIV
jgi:threonine/homoserine/homoserine lactone efflux protein